jgi:hypothetical protein
VIVVGDKVARRHGGDGVPRVYRSPSRSNHPRLNWWLVIFDEAN